MSCFWDSLIKSINNEDLNTYFDNNNIRINPHNLVTILKNVNKKTPNILWNNTILILNYSFSNLNKYYLECYSFVIT